MKRARKKPNAKKPKASEGYEIVTFYVFQALLRHSKHAAFRRAKIVGSIFGDSAVKLRSICVGLHLEFWVDGKSFVTSRIQAVSHYGPQGREELHRLTA